MVTAFRGVARDIKGRGLGYGGEIGIGGLKVHLSGDGKTCDNGR